MRWGGKNNQRVKGEKFFAEFLKGNISIVFQKLKYFSAQFLKLVSKKKKNQTENLQLVRTRPCEQYLSINIWDSMQLDFLDPTACTTPTPHTHSPLPLGMYTHTGSLPAKDTCILLLLKFNKTKPPFTGSTEEMPSSKVTETSRMWQLTQQKNIP